MPLSHKGVIFSGFLKKFSFPNGRVDRCVVMLAVEGGGEIGMLLLRLLVEDLLDHSLAAVVTA